MLSIKNLRKCPSPSTFYHQSSFLPSSVTPSFIPSFIPLTIFTKLYWNSLIQLLLVLSPSNPSCIVKKFSVLKKNANLILSFSYLKSSSGPLLTFRKSKLARHLRPSKLCLCLPSPTSCTTVTLLVFETTCGFQNICHAFSDLYGLQFLLPRKFSFYFP